MKGEVRDGYWGHLTTEQERIFTEFKITVIRMSEEEWNYDIAQFDNYDYLRFLRARKFDLKKTVEMFDRYIRWRIEQDVDHIYVSHTLPYIVLQISGGRTSPRHLSSRLPQDRSSGTFELHL